MKKLLLIAMIATVAPMQAQAAISVDQTTNPVVLKNSGYSVKTTEMVSVSKARANGQEYYTQDEIDLEKMHPVTRFLRKLYIYADPAAEDYSIYHHDTDTAPKYTDL